MSGASRPRVTIASEIDHDVGLSVHDARDFERGDVAPHFEGPEERVVDDLFVQVGRVSQDPARVESESQRRARRQNILSDPSEDYRTFGTLRQAVLNHQVKEKSKPNPVTHLSVYSSPANKNNLKSLSGF